MNNKAILSLSNHHPLLNRFVLCQYRRFLEPGLKGFHLCLRLGYLNYFPGASLLHCRVLSSRAAQRTHWRSEGITIVGRIKSRDVQPNSKIFFSHRFTHFQNNSQKLWRIKFVCISPEVYVQSGEKYTKLCSAPSIFKTNCKLFMCPKGKHKTKRDNSPV